MWRASETRVGTRHAKERTRGKEQAGVLAVLFFFCFFGSPPPFLSISAFGVLPPLTGARCDMQTKAHQEKGRDMKEETKEENSRTGG